MTYLASQLQVAGPATVSTLKIVAGTGHPSISATATEANPLLEAMAAFEQEFKVELADDPEVTKEAYCLRHQVYCLERGYEPDKGGVETDEFDAHSRHVVLRRQSTGQVVGTVRLVLSSPDAPELSFPMQRVCNASLLGDLSLATAAEV